MVNRLADPRDSSSTARGPVQSTCLRTLDDCRSRWAIDSEPVSQPQILGRRSLRTSPRPSAASKFPYRYQPGSTAACPVGGRWPVWCVALAIQLVTRFKLSLRSTPKALEVVLAFFVVARYHHHDGWTTVRCWLMRLGLHALLRPLEQANDWAILIDHTVQIGTVKCFAVVGVRLSQLPYPGVACSGKTWS